MSANCNEPAVAGPHPVDVHVGSVIRARRKLLGISQEKLAEHLGLTFQQVQKYERGFNRISASKLWEIAEKLDMDVGLFFSGLNRAEPRRIEGPNPLVQQGGVQGGVALAKAFIAMNGAQRNSLLSVAHAICPPTGVEAAQAAA